MPFTRHLAPQFIEKLNELYASAGWWKSLVDDPKIFIAIRNNAINAYAGGGSIARIEWSRRKELRLRVHKEYLVFADRENARDAYIDLLDKHADIPIVKISDVRQFDSKLAKIKEASRLRSGEERRRTNVIAASLPCVIDMEAAFQDNEDLVNPELEGGTKGRGRVDFVSLSGEGRLHFIEAKLYENQELKARDPGVPPVCVQLTQYYDWAEENRDEIIKAYQHVWDCYSKLEGAFFRKRCDILKKPEFADTIPHLLIFGFGDADRANVKKVSKQIASHLATTSNFDANRIQSVGRGGKGDAVKDYHLGCGR